MKAGLMWDDVLAKRMQRKGLKVAKTGPTDGLGGTITVSR